MAQRILLDGGQTGTRLRVVGPTTSSDHDGAPIHTDRPVVAQIATAASELIAGLDGSVDGPIDELAAGVSGLTPEATRPEELLAAVSGLGIRSVALAHDSVSAYLAANRFDLGAVTAVGTGVVTLGVGPAGTARVDGWGHLVGDAGSGYWIGREGLDAALRAFDGRGPATVLERSATDEFGDLPELYMVLQGDPDRVARTARFARTVDEAARSGDVVAIDINHRAAAELAGSVRAALARSGFGADVPARVSWMGKVLGRNERIRERFVDLMRSAGPDVTVAEPHGEPLDGVALLLDLPADHPLAGEVHRA
ncbi:N-acetylglucosamine kinase [Gordonia insulae]|uniref:N-acetylmuramic acid/N-acetylglucosamine kinase n=1 Tax=Gordonia insulae TaxID=2420509 RepID=A0A3G8JJG4_9ACTN|nr:BadF/BadG/BcrA/BcrD ATPase family protein [Gordonia insulae]AZG44639.1 N-acetylmuramic acid/N-acetylglucosamine kinase [Gordonia insulae]